MIKLGLKEARAIVDAMLEAAGERGLRFSAAVGPHIARSGRRPRGKTRPTPSDLGRRVGPSVQRVSQAVGRSRKVADYKRIVRPKASGFNDLARDRRTFMMDPRGAREFGAILAARERPGIGAMR